jgi:hypothetical protein
MQRHSVPPRRPGADDAWHTAGASGRAREDAPQPKRHQQAHTRTRGYINTSRWCWLCCTLTILREVPELRTAWQARVPRARRNVQHCAAGRRHVGQSAIRRAA